MLGSFPDPLPRKAEAQLVSLGVTPMLNTTVVDIDNTSVEVQALGDMVSVRGKQLHGVAPVAMQQGRHAARSISRGTREEFRYRDKGELATIGHVRAVGVVNGVKLSGFVAWALWLGIHITYLIRFQNRMIVLTRWTFSYFTRGRGARVIHSS